VTVPTDLFGVNYFPQGRFHEMWEGTAYDPAVIKADLAVLARVGFNIVRVTLQTSAYNAPDSTGWFNFPAPLPSQLARLIDFASKATSAGLKLQVCCFDLFGSYGSIAQSEQWLGAIVSALPPSAVAVIELQNEMPLTSTAAYTGGFDAGWTESRSGVTVRSAITKWGRMMIAHLRAITNLPLTVSTTSGASNGSDVSILEASVSAFSGASAPSWFEWHAYPAAGALPTVIAAAKAVTPNLRIGETGLPVLPAGARSMAQAQQAQADYLATARYACQQAGLPEPQPWAVYDIGPTARWGLWDERGVARTAVAHYAAVPLGSAVSLPANASMANPTVDGHGNTVPQSWSVYAGNTGIQKIVAATSGGTVTLVAPVASGSDNPPGLNSPPIPCMPGQTVTRTLALSGICGHPSLIINWWDQTGKWLSSTNGATITLPAPSASIGGVAPPSAAYATVLVSLGYPGGALTVAP
jgi:hypothetical protein